MKSVALLFLGIFTLFVQIPPVSAQSLDSHPFFTALSVKDIETSAAWYSKVFGFEVVREIDLPERGIRIRLLRGDSALLELVEDRSAVSARERIPEVEKIAQVRGFFKSGVLVDDLDAAVERLEALDVPLRGKIVTESDGSFRSTQIEDPDGNVWQLFQPMPLKAEGSFEVSMKPQTNEEEGGITQGRMTLEKTFTGDLVGTGKGEMLTALTATQGSAGYVAIERVTGTLQGRQGSFVLQHTGTLDRGTQQLSITVVPDSGTGELVGISGTLAIDIVDGKHLYTFEYSLPQ